MSEQGPSIVAVLFPRTHNNKGNKSEVAVYCQFCFVTIIFPVLKRNIEYANIWSINLANNNNPWSKTKCSLLIMSTKNIKG